jgi:phosphoesterase RecJ-like protein
MSFVHEFEKLVSSSKSIVITSHTSPDDDSVGSTLSVYSYISIKFPDKKVRMLYTGEKLDRYNYFKNYDKIEFFPDMANNLGDCDLLIGLDGSQFERYSRKPEILKEFKGKTICIDHHSSPVDSYNLSLILPNASSTSEIIYKEFFENSGLPNEVAESLLLGILGDTGNFVFLKPHQSHVFETAKKLQDVLQIDIQDFEAKYSLSSPRVFELVKLLLLNTQYGKVKNWPMFMYTYLSLENVSSDNYTDTEISDASHWYMSTYLRMIDGYPWGFVVSPKSDGRCGISFRSLPGSVNTRSISERMKIGGGHDRASGGTFKKVDKVVIPEDCIQKVFDWLKQNPVVLS